ncbi:alpha/beta fold hydrolase [Iamia majanohamensis]|uniref:Alpha/beta fold hydrolase n=1 Tax=Iamia majanohamensis TaxID=467976 RepID=A0AAE9Y890_9ACTN|nr:alpha/beta fold hydrolase [Iamia majanohamensis]WCO66283.1 alpha/beta fold hydrolase [Iamia majanohamensis]
MTTTPAGMYLTVEGTGPAVVLTHGFADDSSTFDHLRPAFSGYRVARWDLPGHGASAIGSQPSSRAVAMTWLDAAAIAAGAGSAVLVGHSLGGYLSLCRAVIDATGIAGLVLVSTGPGFRDPAKQRSWSAFIARYADRHGIPQTARGTAEQPDGLVLEGLTRVRVPVLVIVGGDDARYHAGSRIVVDEVPDGELVVVDGAGHLCHQTHSDLVGSHLRAFLERVSG